MEADKATTESRSPLNSETSPVLAAPKRVIRVLSIMEASWVTGPAKNMLEFATHNRTCGADIGVAMSFATLQRNQEQRNSFIDSARQAGMDVNIIAESFPFDIRIVHRLRNLVRRLDPDITQSHNFKGHFLVRFAKLHHLSRWVAFHHGYTQTDFKNQVYNQLDRWSMPAAHRVVTVCRPFAEHLTRIGVPQDRISIQHNMVKPFAAAPEPDVSRLRQRHAIPPGALVVLSAGRMSREKGFLDLVEAVALLRSEVRSREVRFVIVGDGPERAMLEKRALRLGVAKLIVLPGRQEQMGGYYGMADMVVIPSHSEGSPNVLLEAMAAEKAIVATQVGGIPEIVEHEKTALLVDRANTQELADAISRLIKDEQLRSRLAGAAAEEAKQFDPEHYCRSLCGIYEAVLQGPAKRDSG